MAQLRKSKPKNYPESLHTLPKTAENSTLQTSQGISQILSEHKHVVLYKTLKREKRRQNETKATSKCNSANTSFTGLTLNNHEQSDWSAGHSQFVQQMKQLQQQNLLMAEQIKQLRFELDNRHPLSAATERNTPNQSPLIITKQAPARRNAIGHQRTQTQIHWAQSPF